MHHVLVRVLRGVAGIGWLHERDRVVFHSVLVRSFVSVLALFILGLADGVPLLWVDVPEGGDGHAALHAHL